MISPFKIIISINFQVLSGRLLFCKAAFRREASRAGGMPGTGPDLQQVNRRLAARWGAMSRTDRWVS